MDYGPIFGKKWNNDYFILYLSSKVAIPNSSGEFIIKHNINVIVSSGHLNGRDFACFSVNA